MRRRLARELAVQSLYQLEMNEVTSVDAIAHVVEEAQTEDEGQLTRERDQIATPAVQELVEGTVAHKRQIDGLLSDYLKGWQMDRLSRVDRQILRLAAYEMVFRDDVPPKVVVNEAIEMAKHFGTDESGKFVNGVLGKMIKDLDTLRKPESAPEA
ncbi:transcription antitermination factor NusB [Paenibacillus mucilaginosus]|uniref:Transcription antitermination protein NusB n=3 Tax=Paenibacillus mucilaginosus TaxID=61624 RepID=H6NL82_9BACL|nr:transcription antitermination factor NusB [Paenibacillus mucilaginosus]AEI41237.1 transcription antitermination factor NusB [Paenibacillus mucilaginosus KNP414]AFC29789.1 transcription antitermination factor NusB [Paenibacillus mucilaginosus 3016]AFH61976.1 nitrogen utilization protein B [Paenibacillus mucilaginosus K02]MCG7211340.1 transcription antitermination factor NusB [Paenibacillus mucilaginosus]WDM30275.1 transcription antitermination factor NusB [Paenibacillus mucilaginosus]